MLNNGVKQTAEIDVAAEILITQPKPESDKSPYFDLERKHNLRFTFHPFIKIESIAVKDFRKQKIDVNAFTAIIFTSRNAIDQFFKMCDELKLNINPENKYFCFTEAVALYLQKFILYRKRKVFFGTDGTNKSMFEAMSRHVENERFLYVCSENQQDSEIVNWLKANSCVYNLAFMYRSVSNDVTTVLENKEFDIICFFTPSGIKSLFDNCPSFLQNGTLIGTFGNNTVKAAENAGLSINIKAPAQNIPSMVSALDHYFSCISKKK